MSRMICLWRQGDVLVSSDPDRGEDICTWTLVLVTYA